MGTYINMFVEKKDNDVWKAVKRLNPFEEHPTEEEFLWLSHWQHYDSFALLSGERNYSNITPISEPKGFPEDASPEIKEEYENDCDSYSASWFILDELMAVDWNQIIKKKYYLPKHIAEAKLNGENPILGLNKRNDELDVMFEDEMQLSEFAYMIPELIKLLQKIGEPSQVRLVFWFR